MEYAYHEFEWNSILISLNYQHLRWGVIDHMTIKTIDPPDAPLPITETGYCSHYIEPDALDYFDKDPVKYIMSRLDELGAQPAWQKQQDEARQYSLF